MKKYIGALLVVVACVLLAGTTGCQSGWKFSNPFSRSPKADDARAPQELDELDELNEITPPPESYSSDDSVRKDDKEKSSLAQRGKYDPVDENGDDKLAATKNAPAEKASEDFRAPDYSQSYQTKNELAADVGSTMQYDAETNAAFNALTNDPATKSTSSDYAQNTAPAQTYSTFDQNAVYAQNQIPNATPQPQTNDAKNSGFAPFNEQSYAQNPAPNANVGANGQAGQYYPIAQVSGAAPQNAPNVQNVPNAQVAQNPATNVARNFDQQYSYPNEQTTAPNLVPDSDPYSNVIYEPQTAAGGFAPGSVLR